MLIKGIKRLALVLVPILLVSSIVLTSYTQSWSLLPSHNGRLIKSLFGISYEEGSLEASQEVFSGTDRRKGNNISETHNEIFSVSTTDETYFPIDFGEEKTLNPNIIPHPTLQDTWIVVAQRRPDEQGKSSLRAELVCNARFEYERLVCIDPPGILPIAATSGDKCVGDLAYFALNSGPHDARVFYGPEAPYTTYGSNSAFSCFGQWIQDLRSLVEWPATEAITFFDKYQSGTELQRPAPYGVMEKNWFIFWDQVGDTYVHHDVYPARVFARLEEDGSVGSDLAPLARESDERCMARYIPLVAEELESIHQATNSLSITLCRRADPTCIPNDSNTYIFTIFQHKSYYFFHSVYEPYVMVFKPTSPFEIYGISSKPIWIHGRGKAGESPRPKGSEFESLEEWNETEMFYVTSMSWKTQGQKYHGYIDDVLFIAFGIEDERTAGIDVVAGDLLRDLGLCSSL